MHIYTEGHALRILVADDFEGWRQFVFFAVRESVSFEMVGEAGDGEETLAKARELKPDILVLDLNLPKMYGFEVARRLREALPECKIIFFS